MYRRRGAGGGGSDAMVGRLRGSSAEKWMVDGASTSFHRSSLRVLCCFVCFGVEPNLTYPSFMYAKSFAFCAGRAPLGGSF